MPPYTSIMMAGAGAIGQTSSFDPTSISGLQVWLDAADRGSTTDQWDDKSGNNNHYTSASGQFPTFSSGVATFNGSSQYLTGPSLASLSAGSVYMRLKRNPAQSFSGFDTGIAYFGTNNNNDHYIYGSSIYIGWGIAGRPNCGTGGDEDIWHTVSTEVSSGGAYNLYTHNILRHSSSQTPSWQSAPTVGKSRTGYYWYGDIKAVVIYNKVLSTEERTDLQSYLDGL